MRTNMLLPIKSLLNLLTTLKKVVDKKLSREKINDLVGLIVIASVLLTTEAFTALLIFSVLEYLKQ